MLKIIILTLFPLAMFYAAASDMFSMTISNKVSIVLIGGFVVLSWAIGMDLQTIAWNWALAAIVLSVGFGFFAAGWVGGGDVKLAATAALWLGWEHTVQFLVLAGFMGGLLTFLLLAMRSRIVPMILLKTSWTARLLNDKEGVPYGIALGPAAVFVYPETPWMQYVFNTV